jgi:hypothetical protein
MSGQTPPSTTLEPPVIAIPIEGPECQRTHAEKKKQKQTRTSWGNCGIIGEHRGPIQSAATRLKMVLYIRQTKAVCEPWIRAKHQPKPHSCMKGTTIKPGDTEKVNDWLRSFFETQGVGDMEMAELSHSGSPAHKRLYMRNPHYYVGIVGLPIRRTMIRPATGAGRQTVSYSGKWMTGDYDLFEVLVNGKQCIKVQGDQFALLKKTINTGCHWDAIQHPPQAQWVPNQHEQAEGVRPCDMNEEVRRCLQPGADRKRKIPVLPPPRTDMAVLDKPLTLVAGNGVMQLEDEDKVAEALICQECDQ